jgi:hypothetical protein
MQLQEQPSATTSWTSAGWVRSAFGDFYDAGRRRVSLGVDAQSLTGATRLYERAGMHPERRHVFYEKVLRDGVDLATRVLAE